MMQGLYTIGIAKGCVQKTLLFTQMMLDLYVEVVQGTSLTCLAVLVDTLCLTLIFS